ncbi:uncharacterized protein LOC135811730 [Sycon ciliatum]|uniref:uncharacterized protein LOC135811730 n=1 Tax=Sycon ciliatum TaxID=27933 RepID=UPI0031F69690
MPLVIQHTKQCELCGSANTGMQSQKRTTVLSWFVQRRAFSLQQLVMALLILNLVNARSGVRAEGWSGLDREECKAQCEIQIRSVTRELSQYAGQVHKAEDERDMCSRACELPSSICYNVATCQQDPACLTRCWLELNAAGVFPNRGKLEKSDRNVAEMLYQFGTCTRTRIHGGADGFRTSSHFFWIPYSQARSGAAANPNADSLSPLQIKLTRRLYQPTNTANKRCIRDRSHPAQNVSRASMALSAATGHGYDCLSYHYVLVTGERERHITGHSRLGSLPPVVSHHTYGLCPGKMPSQSEPCSNASMCSAQCSEEMRSCSSGPLFEIFLKHRQQSLGEETFDLLPLVTVMSSQAAVLEACSLHHTHITLAATLEWWPGYADRDRRQCLNSHLPSCWCYSSCAVRIEAHIWLGDQVVTSHTDDVGYLHVDELLNKQYRTKELFKSNVVLKFPIPDNTTRFDGDLSRIKMVFRVYYTGDVFGPSRAEWSNATLNASCGFSHTHHTLESSLLPLMDLHNASARVLPAVSSATATAAPPTPSLVDLSIMWLLRFPQSRDTVQPSSCLLGPEYKHVCSGAGTALFKVSILQDGVLSSTTSRIVNYHNILQQANGSVFETRLQLTPADFDVDNQTLHCLPGTATVTILVQGSFLNYTQSRSEAIARAPKDWCSLMRQWKEHLAPSTRPALTGFTVGGVQRRTDSMSVLITIPVVLCVLLLTVVGLVIVVRKLSWFGREPKLLQRILSEREEANDGVMLGRRKSLALLLKGSSGSPSPMSTLPSPNRSEKVNYNYIPMDKLHEAASKGDWTCFPPQLEFPVGQLHMERQIGTGQFGCVWLAKAYGVQEDQEWTHVAVKMLKDDSPKRDAEDFLKEAENLSTFYHPNIVQLLGVVVHGMPKMVVLEYVDGGDLLTHMQTYRQSSHLLSEMDYVDMALDVAKALHYLGTKKLVHRDVAARNCLVKTLSSTLPGVKTRITKLADFGLARNVRGTHDCYTLIRGDALLPVRWMAPESIAKGVFTNASDAWSFGVLMWEIYTLGNTPYSECGPSHCVAAHISSGAVLDQPARCPKRMYMMMKSCWSKNPKGRPSFHHVCAMLHSFRKGFVRRSTKSTAVTMSTLGSVGEYLACDAGTNLDRLAAHSVACPPAVFEHSSSSSIATSSRSRATSSPPDLGVSAVRQPAQSGSVFEHSPCTQRLGMSSIGDFLEPGGYEKLDRNATHSTTCPSIVVEDHHSASSTSTPGMLNSQRNLHDGSSSVFESSPLLQRRHVVHDEHPSTTASDGGNERLGRNLAVRATPTTPASLSDVPVSGDDVSVFKDGRSSVESL